MIDILAEATRLLRVGGFEVRGSHVDDRELVLFENSVAVGFVLAYGGAQELLELWRPHARAAINMYQFGLRRSGPKAWNLYTVFLAAGALSTGDSAALAAIEEDLVGTRKIARGSIEDILTLRDALLPLLPLQSPPLLEPVDIPTEIRQRTTELGPRSVEAFLSAAEEAVVMQILEEGT